MSEIEGPGFLKGIKTVREGFQEGDASKRRRGYEALAKAAGKEQATDITLSIFATHVEDQGEKASEHHKRNARAVRSLQVKGL